MQIFTKGSLIFLIGAFMIFLSGCKQDQVKSENGDPIATAFVADKNAPVLTETYPRLSQGALSHAKLINLGQGVLVRTEEYMLTLADVNAELEKMPPEQKSLFAKNHYIIAEQIAVSALLESEARSELSKSGTDVSSMTKDAVIQNWLGTKVSGIEVSEDETLSFYNENKEMVNGMPYEQVKGQIQSYLVQQKQQQTVLELVNSIGERIFIAVDEKWAKEQDALGRDNSVDRARDSGKPTMANFGSDNCVPCQMMKPVRESIAKKYEGKVNVVYVHADKEQMTSARYNISSIPQLIFFDAEGKEFYAHTGVIAEEKIEELFGSIGVTKN
jgi:thiol-disulfide isomerase/thioredoxin